MKTKSISIFQRTISIVSVVVLLAVVTTANATTHIIQFGGTFGFKYSPDSLNVFVGDTVQWNGDFSMHPLSSTSIPAGAQSFHQASGSIFSYTVAVAGTYLYQCDFHSAFGMTGKFIASTNTGVKNNQTSFQPDIFRLEQNYPNPFNPSTFMSFNLPSRSFVSLKVFDLTGREVATIISEEFPAGNYTRQWSANGMPSGVYLYRLEAGSINQTKKLVLLK